MTKEIAGVFISGYQIFQAIKLDETESKEKNKFGYKLVGPDNQEYYLMRITEHPHLMIVMDMKKRIQPLAFSGTVFTDKDGILKKVEGK